MLTVRYAGFLGVGCIGLLLLGSGRETEHDQQPEPKRIVLHYDTYPYLDGRPFGTTGPYDLIHGTFRVELDPKHPQNREIVDIEGKTNEHNRVEYEAEFVVLRPRDPTKSNGTLLSIVPNRGNIGATDPFWLRKGFLVARIAWQGDILPGNNRLLMKVPVATNRGSPITGQVRTTYVFDEPGIHTVQLGEGAWTRDHNGYEAVGADNRYGNLTVRKNYFDERMPVSGWMFAYCPYGKAGEVITSTKHICLPGGFEAGRIYDFIYEAKNPRVMGLGFASTRDALSFFLYRAADDNGTANPLFVNRESIVKRVILTGASQTGRYTREFLHLGFHVDLQGRPVVQGLWPHITAARLPLNFRFSAPGRGYAMHEEQSYPSYEFPIAYNVMKDPSSDRMDGVLKRCGAIGNCPKVIHTVGAAEYWQSRASLVTTDPLGREDLVLPANVRFYFFASTQHGPASEPRFELRYGGLPLHKELSNPAPFADNMRALLIAFDEWIRDGTEPPPSRYPRKADGTLVPPDRKSTGFPNIPGVDYIPALNELRLYDYGPQFISEGIITNHPPKVVDGEYWRPLVPRVDEDGNDIAGIRSTTVAVPLGTYTGWNLRTREAGGEDALYREDGSFIPFEVTRASRIAKGDPRLSLEERYGNQAGYVARVRAAAEKLVEQRLLLREDADRIIRSAENSRIFPE